MGPDLRAMRIRHAAGALALTLAAATAAQAANPAPAAAPDPTRASVLAGADGQFQQMDANHDGVLTKAEIENYETARIYAAEQARNKAVFDQLDQNHDGVLSREEFGHLVGSPPKLNADSLIGQLDTNHDGKVTHDEFRNVVVARFDHADTNHDGVLSPAEQRAAAEAQQAAAHH